MDYLTCTVRLSGSVQNTVFKRGVSPAEVEVLKAIHGADAVVDIELSSSDDKETDAIAERERLAARYKAATVMAVYPGSRPTLPLTAEEIGVGEKKPYRRRTARSAVKPVDLDAGKAGDTPEAAEE